MKIPLINSDPAVLQAVQKVLRGHNRRGPKRPRGERGERWEAVPIAEHRQAIDHINYRMPPLIMVNFSDEGFDPFAIMRQITSDPWLNHGGIIAFYSGAGTFNKVNELENTNIIIYLHQQYIARQLGTVLDVIRDNQRILFQRAIHADLLSTLSGQFVLSMDLMLVPCYANLLSNYLYNVGLLDGGSKSTLSLVLTEMLTNAIEHGNCGITFKEKAASMAKGADIQELIRDKCRDPAISRRKVAFSYEITRESSTYVIRDEGAGFEWRPYLEDARELDFMAEHGRGILLARQNVERMAYNEAGNEVTLSFRHKRGSLGAIPVVMRDSEVVQVAPGDVVFRQGEESDFLYYVAEGEYRVEVDGVHVANITPNEMLMGEMSFLLEESRSATVIAMTHGRLIRISKEDFINIIKHQPYYGLFLSKLIAKRLHRLSRGELS
jgi:anti-sigma regulatory factor (Ser/Thr protein kinase)